MAALGETLRVIEPAPNVVAYYDGRIPGVRAWSAEPNWLDDGAYVLGVASYAIVDGTEAIVYDTHISLTHARLIRADLERRGVTRITVVLSHWHDDHVAGNEVFRDCEILSLALTARLLEENREKLEAETPPIKPLVMPTRTIDGPAVLTVGSLQVELIPAEIHSADGLVLFLRERGLLLAGDTLEDTCTYVAEPGRLQAHLADLDKLAALPVTRILPNHGDPGVIAAGGYAPSLIGATRRYVEKLIACRTDPNLAARDLATFVADDVAAGALLYFTPYEEVHRRNVEKVLAGPA